LKGTSVCAVCVHDANWLDRPQLAAMKASRVDQAL
jgi:hypothetical protein